MEIAPPSNLGRRGAGGDDAHQESKRPKTTTFVADQDSSQMQVAESKSVAASRWASVFVDGRAYADDKKRSATALIMSHADKRFVWLPSLFAEVESAKQSAMVSIANIYEWLNENFPRQLAEVVDTRAGGWYQAGNVFVVDRNGQKNIKPLLVYIR